MKSFIQRESLSSNVKRLLRTKLEKILLILTFMHEHQQDQIEKKISSFRKNPLQIFVNENALHKRSENLIII